MSVITKRGDSGETDLMFGKRSPKTAPRIEAYGTVDELNSLIGVVRHSGVSPRTVEMLDGVQARLVGAMGELATLEEDLPKYDAKGYARITAEDVAWLEEQAHLLEKECDIRFKGWARPGKEGSLGAAQLDLARSVCRRAERRVVALRLDNALSNVNTALFLNRLSDLCWVLARFEALDVKEKREIRNNTPLTACGLGDLKSHSVSNVFVPGEFSHSGNGKVNRFLCGTIESYKSSLVYSLCH